MCGAAVGTLQAVVLRPALGRRVLAWPVALTATFTVLITLEVTRAVAPRWMAYLGYASAALIATGVVIPLGLHAASLTNFAGYVAWCLWLLAMAVFLWRARPATSGRPGPAASSQASH